MGLSGVFHFRGQWLGVRQVDVSSLCSLPAEELNVSLGSRRKRRAQQESIFQAA